MDIINLYKKISSLFAMVHRIVGEIRQQNFDAASRSIREAFTESYADIIRHLLENSAELQRGGILVEQELLIETTSMILCAQERKDYILVADYLELYLFPLLQKILIGIREFVGQEAIIKDADYRESNAAYFPEETKTRASEPSRQVKYEIELTEQGPFTLRINEETDSFYMHSNVNPWKEADVFAQEFGEDSVQEYAVLGLGLGYHVIRLWQRAAGAVPVHVYECDEQILRICESFQDFSICERGNLYIHYDPQMKKLTQKLKKGGVKLVLHYPSVRNIGNRELRDSFQNFFVADSTERNQKKYLYANFFSNISQEFYDIEEVAGKWKGKDIYIVATGPSLDKNLQLLEKRTDNSIILAVGSVLSKMLNSNIRPDYVIVSDPNERVRWQLYAHRNCGIPLLLLSTACFHFAKDYSGRKYILFQKDFPLSEEYAVQHKCILFETGGSVSTTALDAAIRLGSKKIIFLGLDLAFSHERAHATGVSDLMVADKGELIEVKSNNGEILYSDYKFGMYADWIEKRLQREDVGDVRIINATEGGRYIKGMEYRKLQEVIK